MTSWKGDSYRKMAAEAPFKACSFSRLIRAWQEPRPTEHNRERQLEKTEKNETICWPYLSKSCYSQGIMSNAVEMDFRVFFERSPGLYLVLDPQFFIIAATDNYLHSTVTRREDIVGQHLFDVFPENGDDAGIGKLRESLEGVLRDRVPDSVVLKKSDLRRLRGEFEERYWNAINRPVIGADGRVQYIIHCLEDVTESGGAHDPAEIRSEAADLQRRRVAAMESAILSWSEEVGVANRQLKVTNEELALRTAELHESLQTMQTFTYTIGHDLRAPLRALTGFSSLVLTDYADKLDQQGKDYLRHIRDAAQRMDKLVGDLLAYGRLAQVEVTNVPFSLDEAITKVLTDFSSQIQARGAEIEVQHPLPNIVGNVVLLNQVLVNIIDNALKFVPLDKAPRITISATPTEDRVRLCVTDNGIGIASEYHSKIFDLFVRLNKSAQYPGTGIGLALVRKAMERMLGKVGLESTPGEGSSFWLEFRAAK